MSAFGAPTTSANPVSAVVQALRQAFGNDQKLAAWLAGQNVNLPGPLQAVARGILGGNDPAAVQAQLRSVLNTTGQAFPGAQPSPGFNNPFAAAVQGMGNTLPGGEPGTGLGAGGNPTGAGTSVVGPRPPGLTDPGDPRDPGSAWSAGGNGPAALAPDPLAAVTTPGLGGPTAPGGGGTGNSQYGTILAQSPSDLEAAVLRAMGMNPSRLGDFGEIIRRAIAPLIQASAEFLPYAEGTGNAGTLDPTAVGQWAQQFGKNFTTPGVDAYKGIRDWIGKVVGSQPFQQQTGMIADDQTNQGMLQNLLVLQNAGAGGLRSSAMGQGLADIFSDQRQRGLESVNQGQAAKPFMEFLNQPGQEEYRNRLRSLTGY